MRNQDEALSEASAPSSIGNATDDLAEENAFLRRKITDVTQRCKKALAAYKRLKEVKQTSETDDIQLQTLTQENIDLKSQLEIAIQDKSHLTRELDQQDSSDELESLRSRIDTLESQLSLSHREKEQLEIEISHLKTQSQHNDDSDRILQLQMDLVDSQKESLKVPKLEQAIERVIEENCHLRSLLNGQSEFPNPSDLMSKMVLLSSENELLQSKFGIDFNDRTVQLEETFQQLSDLHEKNNALSDRFAKLQMDSEMGMGELRERIEQLVEENNAFLRDSDGVMAEKCKTLAEKCDVVMKQNEVLEGKVLEERERSVGLERELEEFKGFKVKAKQLEDEIDQLKNQLEKPEGGVEEVLSESEDEIVLVESEIETPLVQGTETPSDSFISKLTGVFKKKTVKVADLSEDTSFKWDPDLKKWVDSNAKGSSEPVKKKLPPKRQLGDSKEKSKNRFKVDKKQSRYANNFEALGFGGQPSPPVDNSVSKKSVKVVKNPIVKKKKVVKKSQNVNQNLIETFEIVNQIESVIDQVIYSERKSSDISFTVTFSWVFIIVLVILISSIVLGSVASIEGFHWPIFNVISSSFLH